MAVYIIHHRCYGFLIGVILFQIRYFTFQHTPERFRRVVADTSLTPAYLQGFCRFYFQAWNITIIIFIKIIKANQTACLKIRLCGYNLRHSHNSMRVDKKEKLTGYVWCGVSWGWGEKWAGRGRGRKAIFKHTLGKNRLRNQTVCYWATPKERQ